MTMEVFERAVAANALWLVPVVLLLLQFAMKLWIGEGISGLATWRQLLQSPVEIGFLALSFVASLVISSPTRANPAFVTCLIFFVLLFASILIWKLSPIALNARDIKISFALFALNSAITIPMLVFSINMLVEGRP